MSNTPSPTSPPNIINKRQKTRQEEQWKKNRNKALRQSGQSYLNRRNQNVPPKKVLSSCGSTCSFKCTSNFTITDRAKIFDDFWKLKDDEKLAFYFKFVKCKSVVRRRVSESNKKNTSYDYYFQIGERMQRVCRLFFLNTLNISKRRIYYAFKNCQDSTSAIPTTSKRGKHIKKSTSEEQLSEIRRHIESFEMIDSHYCRASSQKMYLEANLSITKMYQLYIEKCEKPAKKCIYEKVFKNEYNIGFHKPKKDVCDKCYEYSRKESLTEDETKIYQGHLLEKDICRSNRGLDRENSDPNHGIICYDLQKVFGLPKGNCSNFLNVHEFSIYFVIGNASSFYYKRKLNVYNLTATLILADKSKITYCAIWNEFYSGRSGNDIASALLQILSKVSGDYPQINRITLWSDSCVPQNRNRINSTAIKHFIASHSQILQINQKFSEPGHSNIQEVDCVHSVIDKYLKNIEIYSPKHLIELLHKMDKQKTKLSIIEIQASDFKCYAALAAKLDFAGVPFLKIKTLFYEHENQFSIKYKTSFSNTSYQTCSLLKRPRKCQLGTPQNLFSNIVPNLQRHSI